MLLVLTLIAAAAPQSPAEHVQHLMDRDEVVWIGAKSPSPASAGAAAPVLLETMKGEDEQARLRALEAMAKLDPEANPEVFFAALADPSDAVRASAARVVSDFEPELVFDHVMAVLLGPAGQQDATLAAALPLLRNALEQPMLDLLQAPQETLERRTAAAYSLGMMGSGKAVTTLAQMVWGNEDWLRDVSMQALMNIKDPVTVPKLAELAGHPSDRIRWAAVEALGAFGTPEAIEALGRVAVARPAGDKDLSRRAVQLLEATKDPAVVPILIHAMDRNLAVRRIAVDALSNLTGKDFGDSPTLWIEWWQKRNDPAQIQQQMPQRQLLDIEYME